MASMKVENSRKGSLLTRQMQKCKGMPVNKQKWLLQEIV